MADSNSFRIAVLDNLNVKSANWYKHDKIPYKGAKIDVLKSQFGLDKIIKESTHKSCNDLIFTSQLNLLM